MLRHGERCEHPAPLRNDAHARPGDHIDAGPGELPAVDGDAAFVRPDESHDGRDEGGLPDPVASEEGDSSAPFEVEVDSAEYDAPGVAGAQAAHAEERVHETASTVPRYAFWTWAEART